MRRLALSDITLAALLLAAMCAPAPAAARQEPTGADSATEAEDEAAAAGDVDLSAEQIRDVQRSLRDRGFFTGPLDGRKAPRTRTALREFQRAQGMAVTGSFDAPTLDRIRDLDTPGAGQAPDWQTPDSSAPADSRPAEPDMTEPVPADPRPVESQPARRDAPEVSRSPRRGGIGGFFGAVGSGIKRGAGAVVGGTKKGATATGEGVGTAGKAIGKAGSVTATASASATKAAARAIKTAALAVADTSVGIYDTSKRKVFGERRTDDQLKATLERQYSEDDRLDPAEIEVRVSKGAVTLAFPQSPHSDVAYAVRLAKLTPGVKSVSAIYAAPAASIDPPQSTP